MYLVPLPSYSNHCLKHSITDLKDFWGYILGILTILKLFINIFSFLRTWSCDILDFDHRRKAASHRRPIYDDFSGWRGERCSYRLIIFRKSLFVHHFIKDLKDYRVEFSFKFFFYDRPFLSHLCTKNSVLLKVSKFRKQIFLLSFEPKNERNYFLISALRMYSSN